VCGSAAEIGDVLVEDERVTLITFTGSAGVGWKLRERAPRKRVNLELGNATPVIVAADADLDDTAARLAANAFSFAGQSCISVQTVYVHRNLYDPFVDLVAAEAKKLKLGDPLDAATDVGTLVDERAAQRVESWIKEAAAGGARVLTGGKRHGAAIEPTVIADAKPEMKVVCDEVFGPVISLLPYDDIDAVFRTISEGRFGLQTGIFTKSMDIAMRAIRSLRTGGVILNGSSTWRTDQLAYGGVKESGIGREGPRYSVRDMTEERIVVFNM
jgi:acyl-CoA reductase-like NAD-dependent aldehyde dehydrogenase